MEVMYAQICTCTNVHASPVVKHSNKWQYNIKSKLAVHNTAFRKELFADEFVVEPPDTDSCASPIATYSRSDGVLNNQIKKGLLKSLPAKKMKSAKLQARTWLSRAPQC